MPLGGFRRLLRALCLEKLSIEKAVEAVMREVGPDPEHGSKLGYYPLSMGNYKLITILTWLSRFFLKAGENSHMLFNSNYDRCL
jgi:hypothetical protein